MLMIARKHKKRFLVNRLIELSCLILLCLNFYLGIALISYHPLDPSANLAFDNAVMNWGGVFGAFIADPILQTLGMSIALAIIAIFCWSIQIILYKKKSINKFFSLFLNTLTPVY